MTAAKTVDDYLARPYRVEINRSGDGYFARVPQLSGCMTLAKRRHDLDEIEAMLEDAMEGWIAGAEDAAPTAPGID